MHLGPAMEYLQKVHEAQERAEDREVYYGLGLGCLLRGEKDTAAEWFEKYLALSYRPRASLVKNLLNRLRKEQRPVKAGANAAETKPHSVH